MTYLPSHPFQPHPRDEGACGHPDGDDVCAELPENPIHRVDNPAVEQLAAALASYQWPNEPARFAGVSEHRRHNRDWRCGICTGDLHSIAAAVLDIHAASR